MNLIDALSAACQGKIIVIESIEGGSYKKVRAKTFGFPLFEQSEFLNDDFMPWDTLRLSEAQIKSDKWKIWKEEKEMSFAEAVEELLKRRSIAWAIYQRSEPEWEYRLYWEDRDSFFVEGPRLQQRNRAAEWDEKVTVQFTKRMFSEKDWVIKAADKKEEPKDEKCDCPLHRMMRDM